MIPTRLLRPLTLQTRKTTTDPYGATVPDGWTDSTFLGRIDQKSRSESAEFGREGQVAEWLLLTNDATVNGSNQIVDAGHTYQVVGPVWPVYAGSGIHHYEATLHLAEG